VPENHSSRRTPQYFKKGSLSDTYLVIGGGPGAHTAMENMRKAGFTGHIKMISNESYLPYDRTALSKNIYGGDASKLALRSEAFYKDLGIDLLLGKEARSLNTFSKEFEFKDGQKLKYDKILIATGATPREIQFKDDRQPKNVFTIRNGAEHVKLREKA
jgi:3-phenylpropionate/trans-cinnamate dioxygenase ferredoxin reductase subunit